MCPTLILVWRHQTSLIISNHFFDQHLSTKWTPKSQKSYCKSLAKHTQKMLSGVQLLTPLLSEPFPSPRRIFWSQGQLLQRFHSRKSSEKVKNSEVQTNSSRMMECYQASRKQTNWIMCSVNLPVDTIHSLPELFDEPAAGKAQILFCVGNLPQPAGWELLWITTGFNETQTRLRSN